MQECSNRFLMIDAVRGLAFIGMATQHTFFLYSLVFEIKDFSHHSFLFWIGRLSALMFIFLVGVSVELFAERYRLITLSKRIPAILQKSMPLFLSAVIVTIATWYMFPKFTVWLGILHFIYIARLISILLVNNPLAKISACAVIGGIFIFLATGNVTAQWYTIPLGLPPATFASFDYWPIIPWMIVVIAGQSVATTNLFKKILHATKKYEQYAVTDLLAQIGKHSLLLYIIHFPFLYIMWTIVKFLSQ